MKALIAATALLCLAFPLHAQTNAAKGASTASPPKAAAPAAPLKQAEPTIKPQAVVPVTHAASHTAAHHRLVRKARTSSAELSVRLANRRALQEPASIGFINAAQVYGWNEGVLYRLLAAPGAVTDIALQPGETMTSVAAGDTVRWTVGDTSSGTGEEKRVHILVKPFAAGLSTNLIIATDRRTYHLEMLSTVGTAMAAISWTYPQGDLIAIRRQRAEVASASQNGGAAAGTAVEAGSGQGRPDAAPGLQAGGLSLDHLNFGYAISGDNPAWRPLRAFDDGRQTFIEFPASIGVGEAPPLFVLGDKGEAQLVNYRMAGRYYVVDRLFSSAQLRLGTKKQAIVTITRTAKDQPRRDEGRIA
ncbi:P-type conjugative transfer protein TrbG [Novosphingobium sp.]|uniref:P-type conjugative transfer protein TrbG n=1 Tax=Novosphingobium sp. TaxID=1874826 RepID=UPI0031E3B6C4